MKALRKIKEEPGIWMQDIPEPTIGPNDLLVKIEMTAICGTDIHIYNWDEMARSTTPVPLTTGHEFVGRVVEMGSEVKGFSLDDRVSGEGHITCGHCRNCRAGRRHLCRNTEGLGVTTEGAFAEYLAIPAFNAFKLPDNIPSEIASIMDPLGNAVHTALSYDLVGEDVLITGAGPVGAMACAVARFVGARHIVITDINPYRLALAKKLGASVTIDANNENLEDAMQALGMREGFDVGLEMSGNSTAFNTMLNNMNHGGRIANLGFLPGDTMIDWNQFIFKGLILKGIYGREMFETWYKMTSMLQSGLDVSAILTHKYPVDEFQTAFDTMRSGESGKVLLTW